ncbi:MAG: GxxExxY protein [Verrucomicrobia bacterium]|nr:GxxExxY protein [Verrucomicrobiota bacterium]
MSTGDVVDLADGSLNRYLLKEESHQIIGCSFEVLNGIGHGFYEKIYENALVVEFQALGIPYEQQKRFDILYRDVSVGFYIPDLIAFGQIVVDTKTIERITDDERGKMLNYLKITGLRVGLILNFKHSRLQFERVVR